ncbi:MAG: MarR family transcriptional regulator [Acidobacteriia bacterium]|nr:MarR family transcriptional regulator [Terriglobia bacterium]
MTRLQKEIQQKKPFESLEAEVFLSLERTADQLLRRAEAELKTHGLSPTQYNVLRILRGAGPAGLACSQIAERMVTRDPDITRLLDRLEHRGLVRRARELKDRRVIMVRISPHGLQLLKRLDGPIRRMHCRSLGRLQKSRLRLLVQLLDQIREEPGNATVP